MNEATEKLLAHARHLLSCMTEEEREAMYQAQRESYAKGFAESVLDINRRHAVYLAAGWKFPMGARVYKPKGSWWEGRVVGTYSTPDTPRGYCVQLELNHGPVQIYPEETLALLPNQGD